MNKLLLTIEKTTLITWKGLLVLWALFLGFVELVIKFLGFMSQFSSPDEGYSRKSSEFDAETKALSSNQIHNMDSNGLSESEVRSMQNW